MKLLAIITEINKNQLSESLEGLAKGGLVSDRILNSLQGDAVMLSNITPVGDNPGQRSR